MERKGNPNTSQLLKELFKTANVHQYIAEHKNEPEPTAFHEYLHELCRAGKMLPAQVIQGSNLETSYGYQLFKGRRSPSRDTVLRLAFGFRAALPQAQELLRRAGMNALYPRVKRDAVVIYCLHNKMSLMDAQNILHELGLPLIGEK